MSSDFTGGPGFLAFVATFALVVAGVLLFLSLSRHLRKVRARDARDREEARRGGEGSGGDDAPAGGAPAAGPGVDRPRGSAGPEGRDRGGDEVAGESDDR